MKCPLCESENLKKFSAIRTGTQLVEYLVSCDQCGYEGDMFDINDKIYMWDKLPQKRKFTELRDYRDDGHGIVEVTFDLDDPNLATRSTQKKTL